MIVPPVGGAASLTGVLPTEATSSVGTPVTGSEGFGKELSGAINSLEQSQQSSDAASQALATGTVKDPESAVVTVEDAQMTMELASQIRTKATEAVQNIFQTQV
jgi:flagellar hook-basal body complex protein FliE